MRDAETVWVCMVCHSERHERGGVPVKLVPSSSGPACDHCLGWVNPSADSVNHPAHYKQGGIETIDVIEAWGLGFCLGNALKYIARAGKKDPSATIEDLEKARWYLDREVARRKARE